MKPEKRKTELTPRMVAALKPAAPGTRYTVWDTVVPSFGCRVTDKGAVTYIVMRRLNGKLTRHVIAKRGEIKLAQARENARTAINDILSGKDPKERVRLEQAATARRQASQFQVVAEEFIKRYVSKLATAREVEAAIRSKLISKWSGRPIAEITSQDVLDLLDEIVAKGTPYAAHHIFAYLRTMFIWALPRADYGLTSSPCDKIRPSKDIGKRRPRKRTLTDSEMQDFWHATTDLGHPFGPFMRFLLLTAQRRDEVADMTWNEVDLDKALWSIPAERMKADAPHIVPLSAEAMAVLKDVRTWQDAQRLAKLQEALEKAEKRKGRGSREYETAANAAAAQQRRPRPAGRYVFTTTDGLRPISGFSKAKARIDAKMLAIMKDRAEEADEDPADVTLNNWRLHDLRRTARTKFSEIPVGDNVRELAIAHRQSDLHEVYDQYSYINERRFLFDTWGKRLLGVVEPPPPNVVQMEKARA